MIQYGRQDINQADIDAVIEVLRSDFLTQGETVPLFEEIDFLIESGLNICESGLKLSKGLNKHEVLMVPKKIVTKGFFEKLFRFFN